MKLQFLLFFALLQGIVNAQNPIDVAKCLAAINSIFTNTENTTNQVYESASSQGLNNLGDMDKCMNQGDTTFVSLKLSQTYNNIIGVPYVLCLPDICTAQILQQQKQFLQNIISKTQLPVTITIKSVYDVYNDDSVINFGSVFSIIIFSIIFITVIVASIITYEFNLQKSSVQKKRIAQELRAAQGDESRSSSVVELPVESTLIRWARSASILDNFLHLFTFQTPVHVDLSFLNGTKVLLIFWIILSNSALIRYLTIKNVADRPNILNSSGYMTIVASGQMVIDLFLAISGFLMAAITLERFSHRTSVGGKDMGIFIFHRFLRLWPAYMAAILIYWQIVQFTGEAPMWYEMQNRMSQCDSNVWANILLIDNLTTYGNNQSCMPWGWVVSTEFQFFIIGILLLKLYSINGKFGVIAIVLIFLASQGITIGVAANNNYLAGYFTITNPDTFYNNFATKPWIRISSYVFGMLGGIFYRRYKEGHSQTVQLADKILNNGILRRLLYLLGIGLISIVVWTLIPAQESTANWTKAGNAIYLSFGRTGFILGFFLLTLPILVGRRNLLKAFLGTRFWNALAKLSFSMYLVHQWVVERSCFNVKVLRYYDDMYAFYLGVADGCITIIVATILAVVIEIPALQFGKAFLVTPSMLKGKESDFQGDDYEAHDQQKQLLDD